MWEGWDVKMGVLDMGGGPPNMFKEGEATFLFDVLTRDPSQNWALPDSVGPGSFLEPQGDRKKDGPFWEAQQSPILSQANGSCRSPGIRFLKEHTTNMDKEHPPALGFSKPKGYQLPTMTHGSHLHLSFLGARLSHGAARLCSPSNFEQIGGGCEGFSSRCKLWLGTLDRFMAK